MLSSMMSRGRRNARCGSLVVIGICLTLNWDKPAKQLVIQSKDMPINRICQEENVGCVKEMNIYV